VKDTPNDLLSTVADISPSSKIKGLSKLPRVGIEREAGGVAAIQDGQLARHDATGRTVLMNSRREETALEALTFARWPTFILSAKYFRASASRIKAHLAERLSLSVSGVQDWRTERERETFSVGCADV